MSTIFVQKTVFTHTPLYIETPDEINAGVIDYSIPMDQRMYLLDLFVENGVDSIYSGHVHFENLATDSYKEKLNQYVLTSINHQHDWKSEESGVHWGPDKPSYYRVKVENGSISTQSQTLGLIDINASQGMTIFTVMVLITLVNFKVTNPRYLSCHWYFYSCF